MNEERTTVPDSEQPVRVETDADWRGRELQRHARRANVAHVQLLEARELAGELLGLVKLLELLELLFPRPRVLVRVSECRCADLDHMGVRTPPREGCPVHTPATFIMRATSGRR